MSENHTEEEDAPALSAETFTALAEFYAEQENREKELITWNFQLATNRLVNGNAMSN